MTSPAARVVDASDRAADADVSSAAAQVAAHPLLELRIRERPGERGIRRCRAGGAALELVEHADGGTDLARGAIAALEAVLVHERQLQCTSYLVVLRAFDGEDFTAVALRQQCQAGEHPRPVHQDRAGAT